MSKGGSFPAGAAAGISGAVAGISELDARLKGTRGLTAVYADAAYGAAAEGEEEEGDYSVPRLSGVYCTALERHALPS